MRIEVFGKHQDTSREIAAHHTKRSLAALVVSRMLARRLDPEDLNSPIQLITDDPWAVVKEHCRGPQAFDHLSSRVLAAEARCYVPSGLPPAELPGIYFREPDSAKITRKTSQVVGFRRLALVGCV